MGRALLVLDTPSDRAKASLWVSKAPVGTRVEFKASKRTLPQNDLLWALLTEVAQQLEHAGRKYEPAQWKAIFLHAFGREVSFLPSLDQKTFLPIELSSSDLSKDEMTDFIEFILKEGGERGVVFRQHTNTNSASADPAPSGQSPDNDEDRNTSSTEDGGDSQSPTGSSPSSQVPWLITAARMLLAATHAGGDTDDHLNLLNNQRKAVPVPEDATQEERDRAGSMYRQCKAVVLQEITMAKAKELVARYAGCSVQEIGG